MENFNALLTLSELKTLYSGKPVGICPLYKGVLSTTKSFEATGNPITIPEYKELVKLTTQFSPKQAGTGDPSPENVRAISGWDEVAVTRCGKNLLSDEKFRSSEINGITFTKMGNGVVHIEGTSTNFADSVVVYDVPQLPPGRYFGISGSSLNIVVKKANTGKNKYYNASSGVTIEQGDVIQYYYFAIPSGLTLNKNVYIFLAPGESSFQETDLEPYQGTIATITLPETIYGGTVNAVTGEGSKTWGFIASYNGEALPGEWISDRDVYAPGTTPTTGAQVAYKLATPKPFEISQFSITSLGGENYFFTNGENIDIIYNKTSFWG